MKMKMNELAKLIREAMIRSLQEMHGYSRKSQTFTFDGLEIGPIVVHYEYLPYRRGSMYDPPEGGYAEIQGFEYNGKTVSEEQIVKAENQGRMERGEAPLTVDRFLELVQEEASNAGLNEPDPDR